MEDQTMIPELLETRARVIRYAEAISYAARSRREREERMSRPSPKLSSALALDVVGSALQLPRLAGPWKEVPSGRVRFSVRLMTNDAGDVRLEEGPVLAVAVEGNDGQFGVELNVVESFLPDPPPFASLNEASSWIDDQLDALGIARLDTLSGARFDLAPAPALAPIVDVPPPQPTEETP